MTATLDREELCNRGRHPRPAPGDGRCRPCKAEYGQARRAGLPWDGPEHGMGRPPASRYPRNPALIAQLRMMVGACVACGWTRDAGVAHGCARQG